MLTNINMRSNRGVGLNAMLQFYRGVTANLAKEKQNDTKNMRLIIKYSENQIKRLAFRLLHVIDDETAGKKRPTTYTSCH